jgi:hypothetical protein
MFANLKSYLLAHIRLIHYCFPGTNAPAYYGGRANEKETKFQSRVAPGVKVGSVGDSDFGKVTLQQGLHFLLGNSLGQLQVLKITKNNLVFKGLFTRPISEADFAWVGGNQPI